MGKKKEPFRPDIKTGDPIIVSGPFDHERVETVSDLYDGHIYSESGCFWISTGQVIVGPWEKNTYLSAHSPRRGEVQRIEKKREEKELVELFEDAIRNVRIDEMSAILDFIVRMRRS